ncbi:GNAT family protein [Micromonospora sp. NPDC005324]|uniref:GNAT family N-acetyltransferase n=1 Tax=Micromonospora sp. NPDC005324 TaxID=3157033 RepID=UPI0033BF44B4
MAAEQIANFSVKPTLTGMKVLLRPFVAEDIQHLLAALRDPEAALLTGSAHSDGDLARWDAASEERARQWYNTRNQQTDRLDLAVVDRAHGECVGEVVLNEWNEENRSCNFRTVLGPTGRNRGLGTEATRLIVRYGFEQLGLHRISLEVYSFNPRARRAYDKVGFVAEGVLRHVLRYNDDWIDATVMSILAHEWANHGGRPLFSGSS